MTMIITNYARRCKSSTGDEKYNRLHAANSNYTFCGKELNEMWFIESGDGPSDGLSADDITCPKCKRVLKEG